MELYFVYFNWTPAVGQSDTYAFVFTASDGELEDKQLMTISVCPIDDTDCDGMNDDWEIFYFGDLSRDGTGDYDGDGISDLDEFLNGSDPTAIDLSGPSAPVIVSPADAGETTIQSPTLTIENSLDPDGDTLTYDFEVFADPEFVNYVTGEEGVVENTDSTSWAITDTLTDNTAYYWRARAFDGAAYSLWTYGSFFVNTANDAPGSFYVSCPSDATSVDSLTPTLEVTNSTDIDGDVLTYNFEVYSDSALTSLVTFENGVAEETDGTTAWTVNATLTDNADYYWKVSVIDDDGVQTDLIAGVFTTDTTNQAPSAPTISSLTIDEEITATDIDLVVTNATDNDGDTLTYDFELDMVNTFDSTDKISAGGVTETTDTTAWSVAGLADNTTYYWRARANDETSASPWMTGSFFVNTVNDTPAAPTLNNPGEQAWVSVLAPELAVNPAIDPDKDDLTYRFELYADKNLTDIVDTFESSQPTVQVTPDLSDNTRYYWQAQVEDDGGAVSEWIEAASFFVKEYDWPTPTPEITLIEPSTDTLTNSTASIQWEDSDADSNAAIALYYDNNSTGADGTLIVDGLSEDPDDGADTYTWDVSSAVPEGAWYIYAVISDGNTEATAYAPGTVTIDITPPTAAATPAGDTYTQEQVITLSADEAADFYYTLDGTDPGTSSTLYLFPFTVAESLILKYIGIDAAGNQSDVFSEEYVIASSTDLPVTVTTDAGTAIDGVNVYAFTETGSYTGLSAKTDEAGTALFTRADFTEGNYQFRIDYLSSQFWTGTVALPATASVDKVIAVQTVTVTVATTAGVTEGVPVYLFTESGTYLGISATTDASGQVVFTLPVGEVYTFRADILSSQYWSDAVTVAAGDATLASVAAGGGAFTVYVENDMEGLKVYLFKDTGAYLNQYAVTDFNGAVSFDVSEGTYKVRTDYMGYQFWSADTIVAADTDIDLTIAHQDVVISVDSLFQEVSDPIEAVNTYLFTESGSYMSQTQATDANGQVIFNLPEQPYKVRADYLNQQYWTNVFTWTDQTVTIPMADAEITVTDGVPLADVPVYVFTDAGTSLSINGTTDANGRITFRLPAGDYKFRVDYKNSQYWSEVNTLTADAVNAVNISVGGGEFTLTVMQNVNGGNCSRPGIRACPPVGNRPGRGRRISIYGRWFISQPQYHHRRIRSG